MRTYYENYGEDIDGNRSVRTLIHELTKDDDEDIKAQIEEYLSTVDEDDDPDDELEVVLINPVTEEDVYFTIRIKDYKYK